MSKNKFYVVWSGRTPGVYDRWETCKKEIDGVKGAKYKGFPDRTSAEIAFKEGPDNYWGKDVAPVVDLSKAKEQPVSPAIAVDAALDLSILEIRLDEDLLKNSTLIDSILFECPCALLLIDLTKKDSFDLVKSLLNKITINNHPYLNLILVLNKSDLESEKQITDFELDQYLSENKYLDKIEISIKNGTNMPELLNKINTTINDSKKELASNIVSETLEKNVGFINAEGSLSLILVGDSSVGKTCFLNRYFKNQFKSTLSNIGIDKDIKFVKINNSIYKLTVWDTVGQERFRALPKKYFQNADGVLLLFDVTKDESFSNVSSWMKDIKDNSNKESNIIIYLIGNKIDLNERVVTKESAEELAQSLGMKYFDVSCKNNINVSEIMSRMIMECHMKANHITNCFKLDLTKKKDNTNRRGCC